MERKTQHKALWTAERVLADFAGYLSTGNGKRRADVESKAS